MTAVEIIKMAIKELSSPFDKDLVCFTHQELTNFVNLIAAAEREACTKLCEEFRWVWHMGDNSGLKECAKAIRARGQS
jgi:hypothetical protein